MTPPSEQPAPANRLRELAAQDRPQERAFRYGVGALSDLDLLALLLRSGTRGHDVMTLAGRLLAEAGSLQTLARWRDADFRRLKGIGRVKALQLCAVMEVARRVLQAGREADPVFETPQDIADYLRPRALGLDVEKCWVLVLNTRHRLLRCVELTSGTNRQTLVRVAEVMREVVRENAAAFALVHNHPGGDPAPSPADLALTRRIREGAAAMEVYFLDHVILGRPEHDPHGLGHYSFRSAGLL